MKVTNTNMSTSNENIDMPAMTPEQVSGDPIMAGLDEYAAGIAQTAADIAEHPEAYANGNIPVRFIQPNMPTIMGLRGETSDTKHLTRYIALRSQAVDVFNSVAAPSSHMQKGAEIEGLSAKFGAERILTLFGSEGENGVLHQLVAEVLTESDSAPVPTINFLQTAYGTERAIDLLQPTPNDDAYTQNMRQHLMTPQGMKWLHSAEIGSRLKSGESYSPEQARAVNREWMREVVLRTTEISDIEIADDYIFAASRDVLYGPSNTADIVHKINTLGAEKLAILRDFSDNCALHDYPLNQLERMVRLAQRDPVEIARLQKHDSILLLTNIMGDPGNLLGDAAAIMDDKHERVIPLEFRRLADVPQLLQKILDLGISPSTTILVAHGGPDGLVFSDKPDMAGERKTQIDIASIHSRLFAKHINLRNPRQEVTLHAIENFQGRLARYVDKGMQPSRGIDDPDIGTKKCAVYACYGSNETPVMDVGSSGEVVQLHEASFISRLAESLRDAGTTSTVNIYGATEAIRAEATPRGFYFSEKQGTPDNPSAHGLLPATEIKLQNGIITRGSVAEIRLRNFDKVMV